MATKSTPRSSSTDRVPTTPDPLTLNPLHRELGDEIAVRLAQQEAVAKLLRGVFWEGEARAGVNEHEWITDMWEGLGVVADQMQRELQSIADSVHQALKTVAEDRKAGAR